MPGQHKFEFRSSVVVKHAALSALLWALTATGATAAPISVHSFTGAWANPIGGNVLEQVDAAANGLDTITWGAGGLLTSGYTFQPGDSIDVTAGTPFLLGTFAHQNGPTPPNTYISSVDYQLSFGFTGLPPIVDVLLQFAHNETQNDPLLCPAESEDTYCADIVSTSLPVLNVELTGDDGQTYYFNLVGFSQDGGQTTTSQFFSPEFRTTSAGLYGLLSSDPAPIPNPEPATLVLIGTGLAGAAAVRRRRKG